MGKVFWLDIVTFKKVMEFKTARNI